MSTRRRMGAAVVAVAVTFGGAVGVNAETASTRAKGRAQTPLIADTEMREAIAAISDLADAMLRAGSRRGEAPRLLRDALREGKAHPNDIAAIVDWVLHEKEEAVAAGFADALADQFSGTATGPEAERWNRTARAMGDLFQRLLRDAQTRTTRTEKEMWPEVEKILKEAAPAVAEALRDAGCPDEPLPEPRARPSDPPPPPR